MADRTPGASDLVLDAVGEPSRRAILRRLGTGPCSVAELARDLPVTRPAVSQHLKVLLAAELVTFERVGTRNVYRLSPGGFEALRRWLDDMWGVALDSYAARADQVAADRRPAGDTASDPPSWPAGVDGHPGG